jgi:hypothetical protein
MQNPLMWITSALNALRTNVYAMILIGAGAWLSVRGHDHEGAGLIGGGLSILRASPDEKKEVPNEPIPKL